MFVDARKQKDNEQIAADICIVGAGAAGLIMANEFVDSDLRIVVLEGGGYSRSGESQDLYDGEVTGLPYDTCESRTRAYGGSTNCWGGFCRPFSAYELSARSWIANSGWPIPPEELTDYYARAHQSWDIESDKYRPEDWLDIITERKLELLPLDDERVVTKVYQLTKSRKYGARYRKLLFSSKNVSIIVHANVTQIHTSENGKEVTRIEAQTTTGKTLVVRSRKVVLASGGLENARLMLNSNSTSKTGIGNENDLVGRYFMEHPMVYSAKVHFNKAFEPSFYDAIFSYFRLPAVASICVSEEAQAKEEILGSKSYIESISAGETSDGVRLLREFFEHMRMKSIPKPLPGKLWGVSNDFPNVFRYIMGKRLRRARFIDSYQIKTLVEPEPIRNSRVTLSQEQDLFGNPKLSLDWRLSPLVQKSLARTLQILDESFRSAGLGHLEIDPAIVDGGWPEPVDWVNHHMGTTRMDPDPAKGVVDTNCRVHGLANLYVTGSSVFPTCAADTPTLTLTALSLRLADHLKTVFERSTRRSIDESPQNDDR